MTRPRLPFVSLLAAAWVIGSMAAAVAQPAALNERMAQVLNQEGAQSAFWGVSVVDLQTGEALYSLNAERGFLPASNQKLLTAAGAFLAFGPDYRYQTTLFFDGTVDGTTLRGDLILRGTGDPSFGSARFDTIPDPLRAWARRLAEVGIERIEGRIIGDDDAFDDDPYAEGWDIDYVTEQEIGYTAGGLAYNDNAIRIAVAASRAGQPPTVTPEVPGYLTLVNQAETTSRRRGADLNLRRALGSETVYVSGTLPQRYAREVRLLVADCTAFTLYAFQDALQQAGLTVEADLVDVDDLDEALDLEDAEPLLVHFSPSLQEILAVLNKQSNNFYAEQILRSFGYAGSAKGGGDRLKAMLRQNGASADGFIIRDGSGLSRKNLITPAAMTDLLLTMHRHPMGAAFKATLPGGGEPRSTLRYRLGGAPVRAKTGSLEFARSLSGYATLRDGREVAFAIFANNYTIPSYRIVQAIDELVVAMMSGSS